MTEAKEEAVGQPEKGSRIASLVVLACGGVASVLSVVNVFLRMDDGWLARNPWAVSASLLLPLGIISLAVALLLTGVRKWAFAVIAMVLATIGTVCAALALRG